MVLSYTHTVSGELSGIVGRINSKRSSVAVFFYFVYTGAQAQLCFRIFSLLPLNKSIIDTLNGFYGTVIPFFLKEENELICDHPGKMGSIALF